MTRYTLSIAALFALAISAQAGPEEFFSEKEKDFGTVARGTKQVHYFQFKNTSNETWVIGSVGVSCGCVTPSVSQYTIKPGETATVTASMNTQIFSGHRQVTVHVNFISPRSAYVGLLVKAFSRDDFMIFPESLAFGPIPFGKEVTAKTQISLTTDPNWTVQSASCDSNYVKPEFKLVKRQGSEVVYEVTATLRKDLPVGKWFTDVHLTTSNVGLQKIRLPLTVEVLAPAAPVAVSPAQVTFGDVKVGESQEQKVMVRGDKPFRITKIEKDDSQIEAVSVSSEEEPKTIHIVTFKLSAQKLGEVASRIQIKTDAGKDFSIEVPVKASVK